MDIRPFYSDPEMFSGSQSIKPMFDMVKNNSRMVLVLNKPNVGYSMVGIWK